MIKKNSYWLRSGFFTLLERLSALIFGFGSLFFLLRALSKDDFGVWVLFLTIVSFLEVGRIGLLQNALVRYLTTSKKEAYPKIITASATLNGLLTLASILFLLILAPILSNVWNAPELSQLIYIYLITTTLLIPFHQFNFIQQANLKFKGIFWANFVKQGLFFGYILWLFVQGTQISIVGLASFQIVGAFCGALVSYWFVRPYLSFSKQIHWEWVKQLFNFGKYVFGTNLSTMLYKSIDKIMLGSLLSTVSVALYELAIRITNLAEVPTFSIASIVFPQSAKRIQSEGPKGVKLLYEKSVGVIIAILAPLIFFILLFPEFIIKIIASEKYLEAVPVLRLTILYGLFVPFAVQFGTVLDSIGKPKINFYFTLTGTLLNIVFNYLFITRFGLIGAAYGTLTTYAVTFLFMQMMLYKMLNVKAYNAFYYALTFYRDGWKWIKNFIKSRWKNNPVKIKT